METDSTTQPIGESPTKSDTHNRDRSYIFNLTVPDIPLPYLINQLPPTGLPPLLRKKGITSNFIQKLYYLISIPTYRTYLGSIKSGEALPLNFSVMGSVIGRSYVRPAIDILLSLGIFEKVGGYTPGVSSQNYRLLPPYSEYPFAYFPVKGALGRKLFDYSIRNLEESLAELPYRLFLYDCLRTVTILPSGETPDPKDPNNQGTVNHWNYWYQRFLNRDYHFSVHDETGRIFSNVTSCQGRMRPHLLLDGHPIDIIDISACQPYLMGSLYPPGCFEKEVYTLAFKYHDLYHHLEAVIVDVLKSKPKPRNKLKTAVMANVLYRKKPHVRGSDEAKAFKFLYPELDRLRESRVRELGRVQEDEIDSFSYTTGVSNFAKELQRLEAITVTEECVNWIRTETSLPVVTIHDALMIPKGEDRRVGKVLGEILYDKIGIKPVIKNMADEVVD